MQLLLRNCNGSVFCRGKADQHKPFSSIDAHDECKVISPCLSDSFKQHCAIEHYDEKAYEFPVLALRFSSQLFTISWDSMYGTGIDITVHFFNHMTEFYKAFEEMSVSDTMVLWPALFNWIVSMMDVGA